MASQKVIGTHSGTFHTDEVVATTLLRKFTKMFKDSKIVRTRDQEILKTLDIIVDVGDIFDIEKNRFDHHQKGFTETFSTRFSTKLSSAGLIWKYFGKEILQNALNHLFGEGQSILEKYKVELTDEDLDFFIERIYREFFEYLDAIDNGIPQYPFEVKPKYKSHSNDMVGRIGKLNWNDFSPIVIPEQERFEAASKIALEEFLAEVRYIYCDSFIGYPIVKKAMSNRFDVHSSGKILFVETSCNWKSAVFKIEAEQNIEGEILFVVFTEKHDGTFKIQAVPGKLGGFELRKGLKEEYRGSRDHELSNLSGIEGCIFCHISGFIGGNKTYEGALKMAINSL